MKFSNKQDRRNGQGKMFLVVLLVLSLLLGLVGGVVAASFFARPGAQGEQGIQGLQGTQGIQGLQGEQGATGAQGAQGAAGTNGINSILQILQDRNSTAQALSGYTVMQWHNMSVFDRSMNMSVTVGQNSKIFVGFSGTLLMDAPSSVEIRIVVDNSLNSTLSWVSFGPPSSGTFRMSSHIEFLTDPMNSGQHRIDVQFLRESGSPVLLDRTLTFMEVTT